MFLLSNVRRGGLADRGERYQGPYAAALDDGRIIALAALGWHGNVVLQAPQCLNQVINAVMDAAPRPVKGLIGPADQVAQGAAMLSMPERGPGIQMNSHEGLYALDLSNLALLFSVLAIHWIRRTPDRKLDLALTAALVLVLLMPILGLIARMPKSTSSHQPVLIDRILIGC
jgi:uncharacterized protein